MTIITTSNTRRTLTLKSKLGFANKYPDNTIQEIINLNKMDYLRWVYFNYEGIDFIPDVLDMIQIPVEFRLKKPAKNPDLLLEVNKIVSEEHKFVYLQSKEAIEKRAKAYKTAKIKKSAVSKATLLRKNHGHR